jgi:hypothetical protein
VLFCMGAQLPSEGMRWDRVGEKAAKDKFLVRDLVCRETAAEFYDR